MEFLLAGLALAAVLQNPPTTQSGRISGVVIEEGTNLPVPGTKVSILPADEPLGPDTRPPETTSDDEGRFAFDKVTPGRYRVAAHSDDFAPQFDESAFPVIDLGAAQDLANVNIVLSHGGAITGRVFGLDGRPAVGAGAVALLKRLDRLGGGGDPPLPNGTPMMLPLGQTTTDAHGEFRLERLPSGDYLVAAETGSDRRDSAATAIGTTYYPSTTDESAAQVVSVHAGRTVADITIQTAAVRTFRVSGVVTDADGTPLPNIYVSLMPDLREGSFALLATGAHASAQADAGGAFAFDNIPRGSYVVSATGDDGLGAFVGAFAIDGTGALTAETNAKTLPLAPGTVAVSVSDADVTDVKIVVKKPR
jgi:hypothetical protein